MKRLLLILLIATDCWAGKAKAKGPKPYSVREVGNNLELTTPDGNRVFFGDNTFDGSRDYKIRIPLKALKGKLPPAPAEDDAPTGPPPLLPTLKVDAPPAEKRELASDGDEQDTGKDGGAAAEGEYDDTARLVVEANHLYNKGKFYEATAYIEELIRKRPKFTRAWIMKGSLLYVQKQKDLAREAWQQALNLEPENREIRDMLTRYR